MRVISLFSGAGGFDLGLIKTGHQVVWANDIFEDCCETYKKNIGNHVVCADIANIDLDTVPSADVVIGGFPCQGFSIANMNRKRSDPRNKLYLEFLRVVESKKPKVFIAENVRGILSLEGGKVFKKILADFTKCGYEVKYALVNAADYGVPQNRYRVFIFGVRNDLEAKNIDFPPNPTHGKNTEKLHVTIGQALKGIPEPDSKHSLKNHVCSSFKIKNNGFINHRPVDPNKPAPTVTARGDLNGGAMINHHPGNHRRLSVRESALIQTFPKSFEFVGSMTSCYLQIGNAVPPLLASKFGEMLNEMSLVKKKNQIAKKSQQLEVMN